MGRVIVVNGESTSAVPPQTGRGSWTQYLINSPKLKGDSFYNNAVGGKKIQLIRSQYQSLDRPLAPEGVGNGMYLLMGCANDIIYDRSAADIYDDLSTIWYASRLYGFIVAAFTVMPATTTWFPGGKQTVWSDLNSLIRSDPAKYDFLVEVDVVLPDPSNAAHFTDGLHTTPKGAQLIFDAVKQGPLAYF